MPKSLLSQVSKTKFFDLYRQLIIGTEISESQLAKVLAIGFYFLNSKDENVIKLGYRLMLLYTDRTGDFRPLYETTINYGLAPIAAAIERTQKEKSRDSRTFLQEISSAFLENFKKDSVYLTDEQLDLHEFSKINIQNSTSIVAPTSYGKSELILSFISETSGNICIIVPTKALLAQTKRRIISAGLQGVRRLVTHPEMYSPSDNRVVAVLTQERLLRLLQKHSRLKFDFVIIDEAHNLLEEGDRNILLASALLVLRKRNRHLVLKFLTPFLDEPGNLQLRYSNYSLKNFKVKEYVKSEKIFYIDLLGDRKLKIYDQFVNQFFEIQSEEISKDLNGVILSQASGKNIIYFNKPKSVERFSKNICRQLPVIKSDVVSTAIKELGSYIHKDYDLLNCIQRGVIYHHGSVPENVRLYIESLYSRHLEFRFMATTSTLLEGVNTPADRMFILETRKGLGYLSQQQLKNLIGRVCRFNEIFTEINPNLSMLMPEIYIIKSDYIGTKADIEKFITERLYIEKNKKEEVKNVLLASTKITEKNTKNAERAEEFIENFEHGTVPEYNKRNAVTEVGQCCFNNNLTEVSILENEIVMQLEVDKIRRYGLGNIKTSVEVFGFMARLFVPFLRKDAKIEKLTRFEHEPTQKFYSMFLNWRVNNHSFSQMIGQTLHYWDRIISEQKETLVYVGTWGDTERNGHLPYWTDIRTKNASERVNLAIVRIKEEMDFLDNILIKFIETINELGFIEKDYYSRIKYGTSDPQKIAFIKAGFSHSAANLLVDTYSQLISIDETNGIINADPNLLKFMESNQESGIICMEISYSLGQ